MKRILHVRPAVLPRLKRWAREEGQAVVLVAVSMVFVAGFLALTLDVGYAYAQRRLMQNAADASTAAAVRILAMNSPCTGHCDALDEEVKTAINTYSSLNRASIDWVHNAPIYVNSDGNYVATVGSHTVPETTA